VRRAPILFLTLALLAVPGCGSADEDTTPVACRSGERAYLEALADAPGAAKLNGGVAISECLVENQSAADIEQVGGTLLLVATDLNESARQDPGGDPPLQLGYLVAALQKGAEETGGIHAELVRRVEAAALFSPAGKPPPPPFDQRYRKGFDAGGERG
jgi:hypothetical protein